MWAMDYSTFASHAEWHPLLAALWPGNEYVDWLFWRAAPRRALPRPCAPTRQRPAHPPLLHDDTPPLRPIPASGLARSGRCGVMELHPAARLRRPPLRRNIFTDTEYKFSH